MSSKAKTCIIIFYDEDKKSIDSHLVTNTAQVRELEAIKTLATKTGPAELEDGNKWIAIN
ncbi:MAG: hypothetical protein KDK45_23530 [Leptospiraceae bacterium]|nr:hypothetical protein [Leptospiraceae bacterium]